jgi:beta-glucosidase
VKPDVEALLARLERSEKIALVSGADMWTTPGVERLGIPPLCLTDGPNGARGLDVPGAGLRAACFPCGSALGATWNPELVERVGEALGEEARSKGAHVLLAPTINIHRTPTAGRNFECFSEDPQLSARMAVAYVRGVQSRDVLACAKHFVCNDSEFERHTISSEVDERTLREIYLPPFEAAVREARVGVVMGAYNRLDGVHACEHPRLLREILREEWGFDGFVVSDWFATRSTTASAEAGLDLEMPGPSRRFGAHLEEALDSGELATEVLDAMVRRLLVARARTHAAEREGETPSGIDRPEHRAVAREAAAEAIVLLRNEGDLLPLGPGNLKSLAVIGPNAASPVIQGGGSAQVSPHPVVSALDGIRERCGSDVQVRFERGCTRHRSTPVLGAELLAPLSEEDPDFRVRVELFADGGFDGVPVHRSEARRAELTWFGAPAEGVPAERYAARLSATLLAPESGRFVLSLSGVGRSRLFVDDQLVVDDWEPEPGGEFFFGAGSHERCGEIDLRAGQPYALRVELAKVDPRSPLGGVRVGCKLPDPADLLERAAACAAECDAAIVVVGLDAEWETEGRDRESLALPGRQAELVEAVARANPRCAVVLNAGSPLEMPWLERVAAVVQLWYPGQELGNALADVLFGDVDASGRLPLTFPARMEDTPSFPYYPGAEGRVDYGEGIFVGYRHYDAKGVEPLFPFGHGLSYTRFEYGEPRLGATRLPRGEALEVEVDVTNAGNRPGREVVQLYLRDLAASLPRPEKELAAFEKLTLEPGETRTARFRLEPRAFAYYDPERGDWFAEAGDFEIWIGRSSRDIRARAGFTLES